MIERERVLGEDVDRVFLVFARRSGCRVMPLDSVGCRVDSDARSHVDSVECRVDATAE